MLTLFSRPDGGSLGHEVHWDIAVLSSCLFSIVVKSNWRREIPSHGCHTSSSKLSERKTIWQVNTKFHRKKIFTLLLNSFYCRNANANVFSLFESLIRHLLEPWNESQSSASTFGLMIDRIFYYTRMWRHIINVYFREHIETSHIYDVNVVKTYLCLYPVLSELVGQVGC